MTTEQKILGKILENKGEAPVQWIARQMKISNDYTRFICADLARKGLVEKLQDRDCYKITRQDKKEPRVLKKKTKKNKNNPGNPGNPGKENPEENLNLEQSIDKGIEKAICFLKFKGRKFVNLYKDYIKKQT